MSNDKKNSDRQYTGLQVKLPAFAKLVSDDCGVTAVEFALVALPFFTLLAAIIEIAFRIWAAQNLDYALQKSARSLFTGAFQLSTSGQSNPSIMLDKLKTNLCSTGSLMGVFDCQSVKLDVTLSSSYGGGTPPTPFDPQSRGWSPNAGTQYVCPQPGSIVIISAAVKFPVFFSFLKMSSNTFVDGSQLLQSTAVFRTEPYQTTSTTGCGA